MADALRPAHGNRSLARTISFLDALDASARAGLLAIATPVAYELIKQHWPPKQTNPALGGSVAAMAAMAAMAAEK